MATSIIDRAGNTWTISTGQQVVRNGVVDAVTSGVVGELYWDHTLYQLNNVGNFYGFINGAWSQTLDPRISPTGAASSPSGSSLNSTSGTITDAAGRVWALNGGGQLTINGVAEAGTSATGIVYWDLGLYHVNSALNWYLYNGTPGSYTQVAGDPRNISRTVTGLIAATAYNFRVYASNIAGNGPFSATLPVSTSSGTAAVGVPATVAAAGFNTLVFFSGFDSSSELTADRSGNTATKWYINGSGLNYTIANSVLSLNNSISSFNADISTAANSGAALTTPGAISAGNGSGLRFKYGGFEALLKVDINNISGNGWIAWWANGFQHNVLSDTSQNSIELDFLEIFQPGGTNQTATGVWNWASVPQTTVPTFATVGWGDQTYLVDQATGNAALGQCADWFIVGGIVTPTKVEVYFNSKARRAQGIADTTIFRVDTTRVYSTLVGNAVFDASRLCDMQLLLGGSSGSPFQIDYVAAWQ